MLFYLNTSEEEDFEAIEETLDDRLEGLLGIVLKRLIDQEIALRDRLLILQQVIGAEKFEHVSVTFDAINSLHQMHKNSACKPSPESQELFVNTHLMAAIRSEPIDRFAELDWNAMLDQALRNILSYHATKLCA
jgi:hypothetical protein